MKRLVWLLVLLTVTTAVNAANLGGIINEVRRLTNDTGPVDSQRFTDAQLTDRINLIQRDIASKTDCMQYRYFIDVSTDIGVYYIEADANAYPIKVLRVYYQDANSTNTYRPLTYTTRERLATELWNYESATSGTPLEFYQVFYTTYGTAGLGIGLWPAPDEDLTGGLRVDVSALPADMSGSTAVPFNGHPGLYGYHSTLIYGTVMLSDRAVGGGYRELYNESLAFMIQNLKDLPAREGPVRPRR